MTYGPDGKRLSLTDAAGTRKFFYDFDDVIQEYNSSWTGVTKEYTHGPWVDEPLSMTDKTSEPNTTHYLMKDRLGSIINILDSNETLKTTYSYDAFGEPTATYHSGQVDCMYRFTGAHGTRMSSRLRITHGRLRTCRARLSRRRDAQAAPRPVAWERRPSAFYRARYYNERLGRFFSRDPIFSLQSLYSYCNNSPTNFTDPFGRDARVPDPDHNWDPNDPNSPRRVPGGGETGATVQSLGKLFQTEASIAGITTLGFKGVDEKTAAEIQKQMEEWQQREAEIEFYRNLWEAAMKKGWELLVFLFAPKEPEQSEEGDDQGGNGGDTGSENTMTIGTGTGNLKPF